MRLTRGGLFRRGFVWFWWFCGVWVACLDLLLVWLAVALVWWFVVGGLRTGSGLVRLV